MDIKKRPIVDSRMTDLEKPGGHLIHQLLRHLVLTTRGDILTRGASYIKRLAAGSTGQSLSVDSSGDVEWTSAHYTSARIIGYLGL